MRGRGYVSFSRLALALMIYQYIKILTTNHHPPSLFFSVPFIVLFCSLSLLFFYIRVCFSYSCFFFLSKFPFQFLKKIDEVIVK